MGNAFCVASLNSRYLVIGFIAEACCNILLDYLPIFGNWGFPKWDLTVRALHRNCRTAGFIVVLLFWYKTGLKKQYSLLNEYVIYDKIKTKEIN
jgi:hypothetical protein